MMTDEMVFSWSSWKIALKFSRGRLRQKFQFAGRRTSRFCQSLALGCLQDSPDYLDSKFKFRIRPVTSRITYYMRNFTKCHLALLDLNKLSRNFLVLIKSQYFRCQKFETLVSHFLAIRHWNTRSNGKKCVVIETTSQTSRASSLKHLKLVRSYY